MPTIKRFALALLASFISGLCTIDSARAGSGPSVVQNVMSSIQKGDLDRVKAIIESSPTVVNAAMPVAEGGATPLLLAIVVGNNDAISILLDAGANPEVADRLKRTPLILAAWRGDNQTISALLRYQRVRSTINSQESQMKATALHFAILNNNDEGVRLLMQAQADPNVLDSSGRSPNDLCKLFYSSACRFLK